MRGRITTYQWRIWSPIFLYKTSQVLRWSQTKVQGILSVFKALHFISSVILGLKLYFAYIIGVYFIEHTMFLICIVIIHEVSLRTFVKIGKKITHLYRLRESKFSIVNKNFVCVPSWTCIPVERRTKTKLATLSSVKFSVRFYKEMWFLLLFSCVVRSLMREIQFQPDITLKM